jgi:hypothetical protein
MSKDASVDKAKTESDTKLKLNSSPTVRLRNIWVLDSQRTQ